MLDFLIAIMVLRLHRRLSWFLGKMMNNFCKLLSHSPEEHKGTSLCVSASHQWGKTNNWGTWVRGTWACALLFSQLCCSFEIFKIKKLGGIKAILKFQTTCLNSKHPTIARKNTLVFLSASLYNFKSTTRVRRG